MRSVKRASVIGIIVAATIALSIGIGVTFLPSSRPTSLLTASAPSKPSQPPPSSTTVMNVKTNSSFPCSTYYENGVPRGTVFQINSTFPTLLLCVKFYYYNPNATLSFPSANPITIQHNDPNSSGFLVQTEPSNFSIGGPSNTSEGILVIYHISSRQSTNNGTFLLNFGWITDSAYGSPEFVNCDTEYGLTVGSGSPSHYPGNNMCTSFLSATTFPPNNLFAEVIASGVTTS